MNRTLYSFLLLVIQHSTSQDLLKPTNFLSRLVTAPAQPVIGESSGFDFG